MTWRIVRSVNFGRSGYVQARLYHRTINDQISAEISFHAPLYSVEFFHGPRCERHDFRTYDEARNWALALATLELS